MSPSTWHWMSLNTDSWLYLLFLFSIVKSSFDHLEGFDGISEISEMAVMGEYCVGGKTILVTGGDKGLGLETCRRLLHGGAKVVMACRDQRLFGPGGEGARGELFKSIKCGENKPDIMMVDLSSLKSVEDFCSQFCSKYSSLDVLVCNAGVMTPDQHAVTQDGVELHVGVNHLAHFYLVNLLKNLLLKTSGARVVIVSSMLLKEGTLDTEQIGKPNTRVTKSKTPPSYADSKLMNALFARELQAREPGEHRGGGSCIICSLQICLCSVLALAGAELIWEGVLRSPGMSTLFYWW